MTISILGNCSRLSLRFIVFMQQSLLVTRIMAPGRCTEKRKSNSSTIHEDYISLLHDALLITIISLLPAKDAGRTTIVSKRWRPLWASTPLNLINVELCDSRTMCRYFNIFLCTYDRMWGVTKILEFHPGTVNRFCLVHGDFNFVDPFVDNWLELSLKRELKYVCVMILILYLPTFCSANHLNFLIYKILGSLI